MNKLFLVFCVACLLFVSAGFDCVDALSAQVTCDTDFEINEFYQPTNCTYGDTFYRLCTARTGLNCTGDRSFYRKFPCIYTGDYSYYTAVGFSSFLGIFGIDRFYLGYPTIGLLKLFTFGGFLIGSWIDVVLIATQVVGPANGMHYKNVPPFQISAVDQTKPYQVLRWPRGET